MDPAGVPRSGLLSACGGSARATGSGRPSGSCVCVSRPGRPLEADQFAAVEADAASRRACIRPTTAAARVDLPAPDSPTTATVSAVETPRGSGPRSPLTERRGPRWRPRYSTLKALYRQQWAHLDGAKSTQAASVARAEPARRAGRSARQTVVGVRAARGEGAAGDLLASVGDEPRYGMRVRFQLPQAGARTQAGLAYRGVRARSTPRMLRRSLTTSSGIEHHRPGRRPAG